MIFCTAVGIVALEIVAELALAILWSEVIHKSENATTCFVILVVIHMVATLVVAIILRGEL